MLNQVFGSWKVNASTLKERQSVARAAAARLTIASFQHVPRADNTVADALCNEALDRAHARRASGGGYSPPPPPPSPPPLAVDASEWDPGAVMASTVEPPAKLACAGTPPPAVQPMAWPLAVMDLPGSAPVDWAVLGPLLLRWYGPRLGRDGGRAARGFLKRAWQPVFDPDNDAGGADAGAPRGARPGGHGGLQGPRERPAGLARRPGARVAAHRRGGRAGPPVARAGGRRASSPHAEVRWRWQWRGFLFAAARRSRPSEVGRTGNSCSSRHWRGPRP